MSETFAEARQRELRAYQRHVEEEAAKRLERFAIAALPKAIDLVRSGRYATPDAGHEVFASIAFDMAEAMEAEFRRRTAK